MALEEVTAQVGKEDNAPNATATYDFGADLEDAAEKFGADVVFTRFRSAARIDLQALIRRHLSGDNPKSEDEIQALADEWSPGVSTRTRKSKTEKAQEAVDALSEDEKKQLLEQLMQAA